MSAASPGSAAQRVEQQRPVERVEEVDAADRHRADRVAVVGVLAGRRSACARCSPCCCQYWNAILSAISAAVEPAVGVEDAR